MEGPKITEFSMPKLKLAKLLSLNVIISFLTLGVNVSLYVIPELYFHQEVNYFYAGLLALILFMSALVMAFHIYKQICNHNYSDYSVRAQTQLLNKLCDKHLNFYQDDMVHLWKNSISSESYYFAKARWLLVVSFVVVSSSLISSAYFENRFAFFSGLLFLGATYLMRKVGQKIAKANKSLDRIKLKEEREFVYFIKNLSRFLDQRRAFEKSAKLRSYMTRKKNQISKVLSDCSQMELIPWVYLVVNMAYLILLASLQTTNVLGFAMNGMFNVLVGFYVLNALKRMNLKGSLAPSEEDQQIEKKFKIPHNDLNLELKNWVLTQFKERDYSRQSLSILFDWALKNEFLLAFRSAAHELRQFGNWVFLDGNPGYTLNLSKNCNLVYLVSQDDLYNFGEFIGRVKAYQNEVKNLILLSPFEIPSLTPTNQMTCFDSLNFLFVENKSKESQKVIAKIYRQNFKIFYPQTTTIIDVPEKKFSEQKLFFLAIPHEKKKDATTMLLEKSMLQFSSNTKHRIFWDLYTKYDKTLDKRYKFILDSSSDFKASSFYLETLMGDVWIIALWNWLMQLDVNSPQSHHPEKAA